MKHQKRAHSTLWRFLRLFLLSYWTEINHKCVYNILFSLCMQMRLHKFFCAVLHLMQQIEPTTVTFNKTYWRLCKKTLTVNPHNTFMHAMQTHTHKHTYGCIRIHTYTVSGGSVTTCNLLIMKLYISAT